MKTLIFVILVIMVFIHFFVGFPITLETDLEKQNAAPQEQATANQKMSGVHLVESQQGRRDWELFADQAEGFEGQGVWNIKNVRVQYYRLDKVEFTVTGESGTLDTKTKDMNIQGNVIVNSANGYRFQSENVKYAADKRILHSPGRIRMKGPSDNQGEGLLVQGTNMLVDVEQSEMSMQKSVSGEKKLFNGKVFKIESGSAVFSGMSKKAFFREQVSIFVDTMRMEGPEAEFNYESQKDFLQSVLVTGGVRVSDLDKYATSEAVKFDPLMNSFIFTGRPRVVQQNDEIRGDQIIFIDGGKRVKVENIRGRVDRE